MGGGLPSSTSRIARRPRAGQRRRASRSIPSAWHSFAGPQRRCRRSGDAAPAERRPHHCETRTGSSARSNTAAASPCGAADDIGAKVHAVGEVDVEIARRAEHARVSGRPAADTRGSLDRPRPGRPLPRRSGRRASPRRRAKVRAAAARPRAGRRRGRSRSSAAVAYRGSGSVVRALACLGSALLELFETTRRRKRSGCTPTCGAAGAAGHRPAPEGRRSVSSSSASSPKSGSCRDELAERHARVERSRTSSPTRP